MLHLQDGVHTYVPEPLTAPQLVVPHGQRGSTLTHTMHHDGLPVPTGKSKPPTGKGGRSDPLTQTDNHMHHTSISIVILGKHIIKSNQIKSLLLSHHHSTSALVSEILMSVLQTVQKNNRQFTYGQTVQKNNKQFTYGQTVQKNCTGAFTVLQTVQKKQQQFTYGQTVQKNYSYLHIDSTYLQTVQKTMCKIHIHVLSTLSVV